MLEALRKLALTGPVVKRRMVLLRPRGSTLSPASEAFHTLLRRFPVAA